MSLFDMFSDAAKLVGAGVGLYNLFDKPETPPAVRQAEEAALAARRYADAASNPDSPEFKNLAALEEQRIKADMATAIEEIVKANRRSAALGRVGFSTNAERRDESKSAAIAKAFAEAGERAKRLASDKLMAASNAASRSALSYSPVINSQMYYDRLGRQQRGDFLEATQDAIGAVGDVFGLGTPKGQPRQGLNTLFNSSPPVGQGIQWWPQSQPQVTATPAGYSMPDIRKDYSSVTGRLRYA